MSDLFSNNRPIIEEIYPDVYVLASFVETTLLFSEINKIHKQAPFRKMMTPNGYETNIPLTNCGEWGWTSDKSGYRYSKFDTLSNQAWPAMPRAFSELASQAAMKAGFDNFIPDACLINQYAAGRKLGSHQDKNEHDFSQPIVSVSVGLPAVFQIFGETRAGVKVEYALQDGDVMVWGKSARLVYHGIKTVKADPINPTLGHRYNITFRKSN
jgi:alkylated DNA repair protein (DNA oxidative demethylase)